MIALLVLATAAALLVLADRFVTPLTRGPALVLLLLPLVFTGRAVLTGKVYAPIEMPFITQPLSDHRSEFHVPPIQNGTLSDVAFQLLPWREAVRRSLTEGQWPLLNRFILCGDVLAASMQPAAFSPFTWIAVLLPAALSFTFTGAISFFVAALGAFLLARELQLSEAASLLAATGWMYSASIALTILWPLGLGWALLPLVLTATRRVVERPDSRSIRLLTVALALEITAGHPETLLHVVTIATAFGLFELVRGERRGRAVGAAAIAGVLALLLTAIALLPFLDAMRYAGEYRLRLEMYAKGPLRIAPGAVRAALQGDLFPFLRTGSPFDRAEAGSIVLGLAIGAMAFVRRREVAFFAALLAVAFLAGIDAWPVAQLLHRLPLFSSALNDRLLAAVPLCLAILAAFALDAWPARRAAAILGGLVVIIAASPLLVHGPLDRLRFGAESLPLAVAALVVLLVRKEVAVPLLIGLLLLQRTASDGSLVPAFPERMAYPRFALLKAMESTVEPFRIAPLGNAFFANTAAMYGLEDVRGSTPMTFGPLVQTFPLWLTRPPGTFPEIVDLTRPMLSMMNVKYSLLDVSTPIPPGWHDVTYDVYTRLIENERVLPRAFVPAVVRFGRTPPQELEEMAGETDFARRAWLAAPDRPHERGNGPGHVTTIRHGADLELQASMEGAGFVVISEAAWPGWRAWVDGRRVQLIGANHAFLSVYLPAGEHRVRLAYLPQSFVAGRTISAVTVAMLLIAGFWSRRRRRDRRHALQPSQSSMQSVDRLTHMS